jgi:hypothetical protein
VYFGAGLLRAFADNPIVILRTRRVLAAPLVSLFLLLASFASSRAQEAAGPRFTASALEVAVGGRIQTLFSTTSVGTEPPAVWELRRVRLDARFKVNTLLSGRIQPEFAGSRVSIRDAYLLAGFSPGFQVLVGQTFRPFSLLQLTSSTRTPPIERGARIRGLGSSALEHYNLITGLGYADRDIGLQVMGSPTGAPLGFTYAAGVFNGPLQGNVGNQGSYQLAGRATIQPAEPLRLGLGWSNRDFVVRDGTGRAISDLHRGSAWEVDVEYGSFAPGFHLLGEIAFGDADPFADEDFRSAQLWTAYRSASLGAVVTHVEPTFRVSYGDLDLRAPDGGSASEVTGDGGMLLTPGINVYLGGSNRVMLNWDFWRSDSDRTEQSVKAMFQVAF